MNVQNASLGKFFQFLSTSLLVVVVLTGIDLNQAYARLLAETPNAPIAFCDSVTEIPQSECEALVALYNSTGGANWTVNDNWLLSPNPFDWYGITIIDDHVYTIDLKYNNLTGSLPPELGNLTALHELLLYSNQLTGSLPPELGNLTALQVLSLHSNLLTGSIPTELGNLTALQWLNLANNQLAGNIPTELGNLTALQWLDLFSNPLTGSIPLSFVNLPILDGFHFFDTNLCEPATPEYLAWKITVPNYQGTGLSCEIEDKGYPIFLPSIQM
jgi:Leucine-rich repeat (LRR) protein